MTEHPPLTPDAHLPSQSRMSRVLEAFRSLHVLVLGDAMLDTYLEGTSGRLCREAPVPIVSVHSRVDAAGGAANTAVNATELGSRVSFLTVIGDDLEGKRLRALLEDRGIATETVLRDPRRQTLAKRRVVAAGQLLVRFDEGSVEPIDPDVEQMLVERLETLAPECDAIIVSDYGYGVLTPRVIEALARLQAGISRLLVVDAKDPALYRQASVTAVKPNYEEAIRLLGVERLDNAHDRAEQMAQCAGELLASTGAQIAAVTLDRDGALICERGCPPYRTYALPAHDARAAGAGDTFISALALALASGEPTTAAAELASAAAAVVVSKDGTVACTASDLREYLASETVFISDIARLTSRLAYYRQQGKRIVFTNGCFDILHRGHITYLSRAKALGDVLIVAVNSDRSVARLKGPGRPINTLEDRVEVLGALSCVDHLVSFDEDTPSALIEALRPDVFVKGGDYTHETLPEAPLVERLGGVVRILPYVENRSTTRMIARIRAAYAEPEGASIAGDGAS